MLTIKRKIMKKNIIARVAFVLTAAMLLASCGETYMEENQNAYSATDVIPVVLGTSGPSLVLQTFTYDFEVTYARAGSTWAWSSADATVQTVSAGTDTAFVLFDRLPASGKAIIKVIETTSGGIASPEKLIEVTVNPFCPLPNGNADLAGSWSGTETGPGYDYTSIITTVVNGTKLDLTGIGQPMIADFWGETVIAGGTCSVTINPDGTLDIPRQYIFTTVYSGDNYDYEIMGSGTWDNCGASPALVIKYDIYYPGDAKGLAATYSPNYFATPYMTATIVLD
jgi:hypothetical protein